jgi:hypothetical protein
VNQTNNPSLSLPLAGRIYIAVLPLTVFLGAAFALYLCGDYFNERYRPGRATYDSICIVFVVIYLAISPVMSVIRIFKAEYLRALAWLLIIGAISFRGLAYEKYHVFEYFIISYLIAGTILNCEQPLSTNTPQSTFTLCYAYIRDPWERFLLRGALGEMLEPFDKWPMELKQALAAEPVTRNILECGYRRVRSFRRDLYYVEIAC